MWKERLPVERCHHLPSREGQGEHLAKTGGNFKSRGCWKTSTVQRCTVVLQQAVWERWLPSSCSNILSASHSLVLFVKLCETYYKVEADISESHFNFSPSDALSLLPQQPLSLDQDCSVLRDQQVSLELRVKFVWVNCVTSFASFFFCLWHPSRLSHPTHPHYSMSLLTILEGSPCVNTRRRHWLSGQKSFYSSFALNMLNHLDFLLRYHWEGDSSVTTGCAWLDFNDATLLFRLIQLPVTVWGRLLKFMCVSGWRLPSLVGQWGSWWSPVRHCRMPSLLWCKSTSSSHKRPWSPWWVCEWDPNM